VDREISYLRFYENLRFKAIARILDMNVNTVRSRCRLIREKIKKILEI
jgi:DNA-directed RNA polymerase specialized sigma24 family protein